jgi:hypothetical protein
VTKLNIAVGLIWMLSAMASHAWSGPISLSDRNMDSITVVGGGIAGSVLEAANKETIWEIYAHSSPSISGKTAAAFSQSSNDAPLEESRATLAAGITLTPVADAGGEMSGGAIASTNTSTAQNGTTPPVSSASSSASAVGSVSSDGSASSIRRISSSESVGATEGSQATATATSVSTSSSISSTANVAAGVASATRTLGRSRL